MNIEAIDIVVGGILAYGIIRGYFLGAIQQLGSLGGLVVAILFANLFTPIFESILNDWDFASQTITHKLAYLISFLILLFGCNFLARLIKKTLRMLHLGWFDRIGGAVFCCFKYILIISALLNLYEVMSKEMKVSVPKIPENAQLCNIVTKVAPAVIDWSKNEVELPDIEIELPDINYNKIKDVIS